MKRDDNKMFSLLYTLAELHRSGIGVFRINKLAFLYEYFHIKNFGERYTYDYFEKLDHGPVVTSYKKTIKEATLRSVLYTDLVVLEQNDKWEDDCNISKIITTGKNLQNVGIHNDAQYRLAVAIVKKFGEMPLKELEGFVYSTKPMKRYLELEAAGKRFKLILRPDIIKTTDYKSDYQKGMSIYLKHVEKYPTVNWELQNKFFEELRWLEKYRPQVDK